MLRTTRLKKTTEPCLLIRARVFLALVLTLPGFGASARDSSSGGFSLGLRVWGLGLKKKVWGLGFML